jgi:hypothetical protein
MEHIRFKNHRDWAEWFLIHCIVEAKNKGIKVPNIEEGGAKVTLTINGVECPVMETLRYMESKHDEIIRKEAIKLIEEQFSETTTPLFNLLSDLESMMIKKIKNAGLVADE